LEAGSRWFESNHPDQCAHLALAPIAQLVERTAYTRRELRIGARLEVRVLLGVLSRSSVEERRSSKAGVARSNRAGTTNDINGRWCAAVRNRSRKPGRPLGRGFDSFTFRQSTLPPIDAAVIRHCCARVGWALASPRRCKRPASAVVVQFHPHPPTSRRLFAIAAASYRGRGLTAEFLSATQEVWVRLPPSAPIRA
jgi:hypothetical protein